MSEQGNFSRFQRATATLLAGLSNMSALRWPNLMPDNNKPAAPFLEGSTPQWSELSLPAGMAASCDFERQR